MSARQMRHEDGRCTFCKETADASHLRE
jgi:hypothetical protein